MTHARPYTAHIKVQITVPDQEPGKVSEKALAIKKKIEGVLKKEDLELYEVIIDNIQQSR
jgi:hypothetical protein